MFLPLLSQKPTRNDTEGIFLKDIIPQSTKTKNMWKKITDKDFS